jgi:hypothetical protein
MRNKIILAAALFSVSSTLAFAQTPDPRNAADYRVIFDLESKGNSPLVDGYGAYLQIFEAQGVQTFRYCDNFEGSGLGGRPNMKRDRMKLVPIGSKDDSAFDCSDFKLSDVVAGVPLVKLGSKYFFAMKSASWTKDAGGEILFQFAKRIPIIGSATFKTIRIRATRESADLDYKIETVLPKSDTFEFNFLRFDVSGAGLGIPTGIKGLTADPTEKTERKIDIDSLEGPVSIMELTNSSS